MEERVVRGGVQHGIGRPYRESMKSKWVITYGASGPYITSQMLLDLGHITADECHSTKDRAMTYTYIHLTKQVRQTSIERFMTRAYEAHGIIQNEIYGYSSIGSSVNSTEESTQSIPIEKHVGVQMLVRHYTSGNPAFQPCTDGVPVLNRGLIFKIAEIDPDKPEQLESQSKAKILEYAKQMECRLKEATQQARHILETYTAVSNERSTLRVENALLKRKIQDLENR